MVIGVFTRMAGLFSALATACLLPALALAADDQITQKNGNVITGKITGVSDGQVMVTSRSANGGIARLPYQISDIKSVIMTPPVEMAQVNGQPPATVVAALAPLVKAYAGLPADWVLDAMGQLAEAYTNQGQTDQAAAVYAQINQLYPGSSYTNIATAGEANLLLKAGKTDQALATLQPVITAADQTVSPGASDARAYAAAFLVYGQILEAQKKYPEALEAYLTVKTVFYQNQALVDQSAELVKKLRVMEPSVSVN
jgi:tetratricopeptide (TPR) repeat protein